MNDKRELEIQAKIQKGIAFRKKRMEQVAEYRDSLRKHPILLYLFLELTDKCNLSCLHCGSSCKQENHTCLPKDEIYRLLDRVADAYVPQRVMICLTGGEPMLHPDFYDIIAYIDKKQFPWGMTSNGTLMNALTVKKLADNHLASVSISLDGLEKEHDYLRDQKGAFARTISGIQALQNCKEYQGILQVTTVVYRNNMDQLEEIYQYLCELGIKDWRLTNIEPIGRSLDRQELLLQTKDYLALLSFIKEKRLDRKTPMKVSYGCSHYLTIEWEKMTRDNYFFCGAGINVAGILCNGDICSCLDIERRPELVQGNIKTDDFVFVWENRFLAYRKDRTEESTMCSSCSERHLCGGDSYHTWDFDKKEPRICLKREFEKR